MFKVYRKEMEWGGKTLTLETGRIARQADGTVLVTYGETSVLCTVVSGQKPKEGQDFFPLTVNYQEKAFAAGKIPGGYFKREGRPSEKETLVSRLIDRPIRPLFPEGFLCDTQVIATVLSHDLSNDSDIAAIIGCSAALTISGIPFLGPIGAAKVGFKDNEFILNPTIQEKAESELELVVAGTRDGVLMVESEAKELSEEKMLEAVVFGHKGFQPVLDLIISLAEAAAKEPRELLPPTYDKKDLQNKLKSLIGAELSDAYSETAKMQRYAKLDAVKAKAVSDASLIEAYTEKQIAEALEQLKYDHVRNMILDTGKRIDGRDTKTVRPIVCEVGVLPRTHGSALFTRGETQALVVTTLGTGQDEQIVDALEG
ncbi:MAG: polyribonucleotide nucleotidyltransferase, partial [Alphaproteobacteria bacterium]|nr:polyribonucleotide nucleotidyltransferase [Alphaproteobacteria bacterium]